MRLLFLFGIIFFSINTFGQTIDLKLIEKEVKNQQSNFYYPNLLNRFQQLDTTLKKTDFPYLYYGFAYQATYDPVEHAEVEARIRDLNIEKKYSECVTLCDSLLGYNPVSLTALFEKSFALSKLNKPSDERVARSMYNALLRAVLNSGDGLTYETAFVILSTSDETEILSSLNYNVVEKERKIYNGKFYDIWTLGKNKKKINQMFFDITTIVKFEDKKYLEELKK
ncbi:MAG: DUF4919 domain-containing protein [Cytophagaceae bacterium]